tara:strand:+ start:70 stop:375 length:306 start_codon:yes stop_codon:yes gene_type:complete
MELSEEIKVYLDENEYKKIVNDTAALSREELKAVIDYWEDEAKNLVQELIQNIAITELKKRNKEREDQIKLLNQSLLASSKIGRMRSNAKAFLRRYIDVKD